MDEFLLLVYLLRMLQKVIYGLDSSNLLQIYMRFGVGDVRVQLIRDSGNVISFFVFLGAFWFRDFDSSSLLLSCCNSCRTFITHKFFLTDSDYFRLCHLGHRMK